MTFKEFGKLADAIKTYFPRDNMLPTDIAMELWYDILKDMDYQSAYIGLKSHVATSKFAPTIADIRNGAVISQPQELNEMEAWSLVSKAIRNSGYNSMEEFAKFPPLVQKAVGLPEQLRIWALDEDYNESVVSSNFMRAYRNEVSRAREISKMPKQVSAIIENAQIGSHKAQIEQKRNEAIGRSRERIESENKAIGTIHEGIPIPAECRKILEGMRYER